MIKGGVFPNGALLFRQLPRCPGELQRQVLACTMKRPIYRTITSIATGQRIVPRTSIQLSSCFRQKNVTQFPSMARFRADQAEDRGDMRPRPPELDLKSQNSEAMNEIQRQREIKAQETVNNSKQAKSDVLQEETLSKAEQRKVNWGILKTLVKYIWPKDNIGFRVRVVIALSLLVGAKVLNVQVPFFFKDIIDKLNIDFSQLGTAGSVNATVFTVAGTAILGCTCVTLLG